MGGTLPVRTASLQSTPAMDAQAHRDIRRLLDDYLRMYAARDPALTTLFSEDFSGFTGGGDFLVKDRERWVGITLQDFAQVRDPIRIEPRDVALQSLSDTVAVATSFFTIHLPVPDQLLSRETARLVLVFRREEAGWRIVHSSISIPYYPAREGEVYPLGELRERNQTLERAISERTVQLSVANASLREANAALQMSEERYRSILNASPDDITITDREGRILIVSPMAHILFRSRDGDQFLGKPITDFLVPEDRARAAAQVARKAAGVRTGPSEYRGLRYDGSVFDIEVNSDIIRDADGGSAGMVVIVRDITERRRAEAERDRLELQSLRVQKAESLGRMAGAIAHNFNNQLQAVMLGIELARLGMPAGTPRQALDDAMDAARRAAGVSHQMRTYIGQAVGGDGPLDLAGACRQALPLLRILAPPHVTFEADIPDTAVAIRSDPAQVQQILTNLVTNACEAVGSVPGSVRLCVRVGATAAIPGSNRFPVDWHPQAEDHACIEVADTGCGIAAGDLERIFDPFFSSKFVGRGLGLSVVLGIVRAHGGVVTVESEPGRGSTFRVHLPLSAAMAAPAAGPGPDAQAPAGAGAGAPVPGGGVLVVDDEAPLRRAVSYALARAGFQVIAADDGVEALELFQANRGTLGCVLCDLTMPRMNGWETLAALRRMDPNVPFILASGYGEGEVMAGEHADRPQAYLQKPYEMPALVAAVRRALARPGTPDPG